MKKTYKNLLSTACLLCMSILLTACPGADMAPTPDLSSVEGLKPIYASEEALQDISLAEPRNIESPGKIYIIGDYLFVAEKMHGVHIINNQDPSNPQRISFIKVTGNVDMAVKNNILYLDQINDLIALDISDPQNAKVVKRVENVFSYPQKYPMHDNIYFECVDETKGIVIGWEKAILNNPTCRK